jgi:hypothetical protein
MYNSIFKYYSGDLNSINCLENEYFWFSKPPYFNDPFDCSMEHLVNRDSQLSNLGKDFIRENTKEFGVCCFSEDPVNLHMWAQYANSYKGFCLEFDKDVIQSFCSDLFQANCELMKCDYRDCPIDLNEAIDWIFHDDGNTTRWPLRKILSCDKESDKLFEMLLLQKNKKIWTNEQEWRIILSGRAIRNGADDLEINDLGYKIPFPKNALKSIIVGLGMGDGTKEEIERISYEVYEGSLELKGINLDHDNWEIKR